MIKNSIICGQFFRYKDCGESFILQLRDEVVRIPLDDVPKSTLLSSLFSLDVTPKYVDDSFLNLAKTDLRVMHQDVWEALISFVCSAAANIPKIQKNLEALSKTFGKKVLFEGEEYYAFPDVGSLNDLEKIRLCGVGYRAKYLFEINKVVDAKFLETLKKKSYEDAKQMLITLPGVGEKIADCVCLYSLGHHQAFPLDVWMKRVLKENYGKEGSYEDLSKWARTYFGEYAGWAQQHLYHFARNLNMSSSETYHN